VLLAIFPNKNQVFLSFLITHINNFDSRAICVPFITTDNEQRHSVVMSP